MKDRRFLGQKTSPRPELTPEQKEKQKARASCYMTIKFQDGNEWSKWSNEWAQANKFRNISDAINEMFRIFDQYFAGRVYSAAIFDTRRIKGATADNKVYQYEKGSWKMVNPVTW